MGQRHAAGNGLDMAILCENEKLDWELMVLDIIEIQKAPARDTEADVVCMANQFEAEIAGGLRLAAEKVPPRDG